MKLRQIREYSKNSLKGHRGAAFVISLCVPFIIIFFRLLQLCTASVILYLTDITPMELFYGSRYWWFLFDFICVCLKVLTTAAVMPIIINKFSDILNIELPKQEKLFRKNIGIILTMKTVSLVSLMPAVLFMCILGNLIIKGYERQSSGAVFLMIHAVTLTLISVIFWMWIITGMTAMPFLETKHPEIGNFRLMRLSFKVMRSARMDLIKILLFYMTFILVPYLMPEFLTSLMLYVNICIKEVEYIGGESLYSRNPKSHDASKISDRKKRHIKTSPDEA